MKWTLQKLENLENDILLLYQTTELDADTLANVMGKIDTERYKINQGENSNSRALTKRAFTMKEAQEIFFAGYYHPKTISVEKNNELNKEFLSMIKRCYLK